MPEINLEPDPDDPSVFGEFAMEEPMKAERYYDEVRLSMSRDDALKVIRWLETGTYDDKVEEISAKELAWDLREATGFYVVHGR